MLGAEHAIEYRSYFPGWGFVGESTPEEVENKKAQEALALQYRNVPEYELATYSQCLDYVQSQKMSDNETQLRMFTWQRVNDDRLDFPRGLTETEVLNLESLLLSWPTVSEGRVLIKTEILRELGQFELAAAVLDREFSSEAEAKAEQIMQAIERKDDQPFIFAPTRDDGDIEFVWSWRARRYKPEVPRQIAGESFDPPIFLISNRDWWVKVLDMCSHNWALIETERTNGADVYFFHDKGTVLSSNGYRRGQVKGRSAVVDSLSFESLSNAQETLRQNGFERLVENPGPWFGFEPIGHFYDARATEEGIYSRKGYWQP
jgi:hypothetical protein